METIAETLRARVRRGRYAPGQRLVEAELARELQTSRGPVREALRRLAAEGLLELEPHRGAYIPGLSREDVLDLLEVLEGLARVAVERIARRPVNPPMRHRLRSALAASRRFRRSQRSRDVAACMDENGRFHAELTAMSGNPLLARLLSQLQVHVYRLGAHGVVSHADRGRWTEGHEEILERLLAGDRPGADRALRGYARRVRTLILEASSAVFPEEA